MEELLAPSIVARNGTVVSALRRTCGQDPSVEGVRQTQPRVVGVGRNGLHQVSARTKCWHTRHTGMRRPNYVIYGRNFNGMKVMEKTVGTL